MYCKAVTTHNSNKFFLLLVLLAGITIAGCSAPISPALKTSTDFLITFPEVAEDPDAYRGKPVLWGGDILRTMPQDDGTTLIEIRQRTLAMNEEPKDIYPPEGRFFVCVNRPLDPSLYHAGREITVAGEIMGKKIMLSENTRQQYPLISSDQLYLWRDRGRRYLPEYFQQYPPSHDDPCADAPWWWCDY